MKKLDEIKQNKIANLMDKKINHNQLSEHELMELRRDLQPVSLNKLKAENNTFNLNPVDKQKKNIDEIRNLINLNKKKKEEEEVNHKSEDKLKEEELEKRRNHFNEIKNKLKSNFNHFSNENDSKQKEN